MRLTTYRAAGIEAAGVLIGDRIADAGGALGGEPMSMRELIAGGRPLLDRLRVALEIDPARAMVSPVDLTSVAPLPDPGKIVAIGLNYIDHAAEAEMTLPSEPLVFAKFPSSIVGPGDAIAFDRGLTDGVDFEAELGAIIGSRARDVRVEDALGHVFGYTCLNDVSARDLQFADGQWVRAKSLDTFCPIGPWIVTADELPDPQTLAISCTVSGERLQDASTADMIFGVAELIARLSRSFSLEPGDLIATGTPPGVGWFRTPRRVLRDGDEVVVAIEGIGDLRNPVRASGTPAAATDASAPSPR
jgi:2-keto-4-pentenoate hydratase/2-oxohepta-3-ene-1,7-dioic acid hydratase in catechol pathway